PRTLAIRQLRSGDRPRERLQHLGARALSTAELLAILVGSGGAGYSALDTGHAILAAVGGSLRRLGGQPMADLTRISGVGRARAAFMHAALELGRRWAEESVDENPPIGSPSDVVDRFGARMRDLGAEEFHVIVLDALHRAKRDVTVTRGLLDSSPVHPREVFQEAIAERAAAIVLLHNHPSGDPTPSPEDRAATAQLVATGWLLDIPVYDHVIVGRNRHVSFLEEGWL
ncbi:MAG TPA: DNA repair protein RadC, partial [Gemmatimonadaceae bacterium]|nr:DNA repair protein RadC [Gemmatimonadaceae bacterium]